MPLKCNKKDFQYLSVLNKISADIWNYCVEIDKEYKKETGKSLTLSQLEFQTKQKFQIHAKGIHHIVFKYYHARSAMWQSRKAKHKNSRKVELPYKKKKYIPTGWDNQAFTVDYHKKKIFLAALKGRGKVTCKAKSIPQNIVEIELVYKDKYYLAIKYKKEDNTILIQSNNVVSIDLGEIHAITSIDNNGNCVIITNRKVRSLIRLKDKHLGELLSLRSKCQKYSKQYHKYSISIRKLKHLFNRKIKDAIHKQTRLYTNWCVQNKIKSVYYGDLDSTTRNTKGKKKQNTNHKLNMWRYGQIIEILTYKLNEFGISLIKINEAYSSQICPYCGNKKKTSNRNYICKCGYKQHRDIVGAINILNMNTDYKLQYYTNKVYLQIC